EPSLSPSASTKPSLDPSSSPSKSKPSEPSTEPSLSPSSSVQPSSNPIPSPTKPPTNIFPTDKTPSSEPSSAPSAPMCLADPVDAGCLYIQGATPPVEISLAFVDGRKPPFSCIQVELQKGCIVDVPITGGVFTINKEKCHKKLSKAGKLDPKVRLLKYGTLLDDKTCTLVGDLSGTGTIITTSCSMPIYAGKSYAVAFGGTSSAELFITAFCNAGRGGTNDCMGNFPPEYDFSESIFE
ncbi:hypothetical protein ACHAXM_008940, partial [Skeletonema potamos]